MPPVIPYILFAQNPIQKLAANLQAVIGVRDFEFLLIKREPS